MITAQYDVDASRMRNIAAGSIRPIEPKNQAEPRSLGLILNDTLGACKAAHEKLDTLRAKLEPLLVAAPDIGANKLDVVPIITTPATELAASVERELYQLTNRIQVLISTLAI